MTDTPDPALLLTRNIAARYPPSWWGAAPGKINWKTFVLGGHADKRREVAALLAAIRETTELANKYVDDFLMCETTVSVEKVAALAEALAANRHLEKGSSDD